MDITFKCDECGASFAADEAKSGPRVSRTVKRLRPIGACGLFWLVATALFLPTISRADTLAVFWDKATGYTQTSSAPPTSPDHFYFHSSLTSQNDGTFDSVSMSYPGPGSPISLPESSPTSFFYTSFFASKSAMDAAFPDGSYDFTASNNSGGTSRTINTSHSDNYTTDIPALTAASFNGLQGVNPASAYTLFFNPFTPGQGANIPFTFFFLSDFTTGAIVFQDPFLSPATTSLVIPANTMTTGHKYQWEIQFSSAIQLHPEADVTTEVDSVVLTDGTFETVPEPRSGGLLSLGLVALAAAVRRRKP